MKGMKKKRYISDIGQQGAQDSDPKEEKQSEACNHLCCLAVGA